MPATASPRRPLTLEPLEPRLLLSVIGVLLERGHDHGLPAEDEEFSYAVEVRGPDLTGLQVDTPWTEHFDSATYLPPGWAGEYTTHDEGPLGIAIEAGTDGADRFIFVEWYDIPPGEWVTLDTTDTTLAAATEGGPWNGTVDFSAVPQPGAPPNITYPVDGTTNADLMPTFQWDAWAAPGPGGGVWFELAPGGSDLALYTQDHAPADTTQWASTIGLDPGADYEFAADFHNSAIVPVSGVDATVTSWNEASAGFSTRPAPTGIEVIAARGLDHGYPGNEVERCFLVEAIAPGLASLEVEAPWGADFSSDDYLPPGWAGQYVQFWDDDFDLYIEAGTDGPDRFIYLEWEEISQKHWDAVDRNGAELGVAYAGGWWEGDVDFAGVPVPDETPNITAPAHGTINAPVTPDFAWGAWTDPGPGAGVWWAVADTRTYTDVVEVEHAPPDTTDWTPDTPLEEGVWYEFAADFHNTGAAVVADAAVYTASYSESSMLFLTEGPTAALDVWVDRGRDYGGPGSGDDERDCAVGVDADGLLALEVTTPWGAEFDSWEYLAWPWDGSYFEVEDDGGLWFEGGTDEGTRWFEVGWDELSSGQWASLQNGQLEVTVLYDSGEWEGSAGFAGAPMPTEVPQFTSPEFEADEVPINPIVQWEAWTTPGPGAGIWYDLTRADTDTTVYEEEHEPAGMTQWTPPGLLDTQTDYEFALDFHNVDIVAATGVDVWVESWTESYVEFTTGAAGAVPRIALDEPAPGSFASPGDSQPVAWTDSDPDSDAQIDLFWDTDRFAANNLLALQGTTWGTIATGISEDDAADTLDWTVDAPAGIPCFFYATIDDGETQSADYTTVPIQIIKMVDGMAVVRSHTYANGVVVSLYDVDPGNGLDVPVVAWTKQQFRKRITDVAITPGSNQTVNAITLYDGANGTDDLGILVENNLLLKKLDDKRAGTPDLAFLASQGAVNQVKLRQGIAGAEINGLVGEGGWTLPADIDADGATDDLTGLYTPGRLAKIDIAGDAAGEIVGAAGVSWRVRGTLATELTLTATGAKGVSLGSLSADNAGNASLRAPGGVKKISSGDWADGLLEVDWITSLATKANKRLGTLGDFGADLVLGGLTALKATLGKAKISGDLHDAAWQIGGHMGSLAVKLAVQNTQLRTTGNIKSVSLASIHDSLVFAGVAGGLAERVDEAADFAQTSAIGKFQIKGIKNDPGPWFENTQVAAHNVGKVTVKQVETDNGGTAFGISGVDIVKVTWRQDGEKYRWPEKRAADWPDVGVTVDFIVEEVV